tara:strand:+ start:594 stop:797 length:204 start_codon:yes stop_codon:yes gene_type:complete
MTKQLLIKTIVLLTFTPIISVSADSSLLPMYGGENRKNHLELLEKDNPFIYLGYGLLYNQEKKSVRL